MSATIATLFSGGEGVGIGARAAGLEHIWGIEYDDGIAQVARENGFDVWTADVRDVNPDDLQRPDVLHASPPCPNFSSAKVGAAEDESDVVLAQRVAEFIKRLRPAVFTLENVYPYRKSQSWGIIRETLSECGYWMDLAHMNAANFGVAQTRKRMVVRAMRGQMVPYLPQPQPWQGWYDAIDDLIPSLPESNFARWQIERLPEILTQTVLVSQGISRDHRGREYGITVRQANELRAVLIGGQFNKPAGCDDREPQMALDDQPAFTVTASYKGDWRGLIVNGANAGRDLTVRWDDELMFTIDISRPSRHPKNAVMRSGQIVRMNIRALARFQSFPDSYRLPDRQTLAGRIIGNAVPPVLYEKIIRQLIQTRET